MLAVIILDNVTCGGREFHAVRSSTVRRRVEGTATSEDDVDRVSRWHYW